MRRAAVLVAVLTALALPAGARAATVALTDDVGDYSSGYRLDVEGGPGADDVRVTVPRGNATATVSDATASLTPGPSCVAVDAHHVSCTAPTGPDSLGPVVIVDVELGGGNDVLRSVSDVSLDGFFAGGGPGDDRLDAAGARRVLDPKEHFSALGMEGGPGDDELVGSPQADGLAGGPGRDVLRGGGGADDLASGPGDDRVLGGPGRDMVDYGGRQTPLRVDLAQGTGGARGEHDRLSGVEDVTGGSARDVLLGDSHANMLQGSDTLYQHRGAGDVLAGRGGDDELLDFGGRSRLDGGPGNDSLVGIGARDALACGRGTDALRELQMPLLVPSDCERVVTQVYDYRLAGVGRRAVTVVTRDTAGPGSPCTVDLTLRPPGRGPIYARRRFRRPGRLRLPLTRAGRAAAARHAVAEFDAFERCGDTHDIWRVRL